jgi:solute carrier family 25 uncoupling protein 8/9
LYTPIKTIICGDATKPSLEMKVLSGSLSGGLAAAVTSPIELIKVRLWARKQISGALEWASGF